ncbi:hypothetical protein EYC98_10665 [Halieaceae bacterium IMCC14734]|uniref:Uncharacterized protein n=1 Tax=Candidatus Litorirhabdus singularis TaxID=2518993 RepID=A0ABT3TG92_9GAMM|nr:hypothetical protein [Candidatus Litorirhabdus singularis]MCX2981326.1 hypothetical protein [Candidatus Litorirhabdus singularis]
MAHALVLGAWFSYPEQANKALRLAGDAWEKMPSLKPAMNVEAAAKLPLHEEISSNFAPWAPLAYDGDVLPTEIRVGDRVYASLKDAAKALKDNDLMEIGAGVYRTGFAVKANNVTILGRGHVVIEKAAIQGKAAMVIQGNNTTLHNIECRFITVRDKNGACVRLSGSGLVLEHVYFHDSQQGVLTGGSPGTVRIYSSRFERLGNRGRAHGIYIGGGKLIIDRSLFLAAKSEGHEIKSRSASTRISNTVIASFSSRNSRLLDISNGGVLSIKRSVLAQGPGSANGDMIGYGLEGYKYKSNAVTLQDNVILLERNGRDVLYHAKQPSPALIMTANLIIGSDAYTGSNSNLLFDTRAQAGLPAYPFLPEVSGQDGS